MAKDLPTADLPAGTTPSVSWPVIIGVLDVLERHGFHKADDQHTGQAVGLIGKLARVYAGGDE
jgi:hypothetical protein